MAKWLMRGVTVELRAEADRKVRDVVEATLEDIETRGDAAPPCSLPLTLLPSSPAPA